MDNIKIDDVEHTSNGDHMYADKQICLLEESDTQCGYVFYNELTRLLKFNCTYCRETYDNIEYFCHHLSEHINESHEEQDNTVEPPVFKQKGVALESELVDSEEYSTTLDKDNEVDMPIYNSLQTDDENTQDAFEYDHNLKEEDEECLRNENIPSDFNGTEPTNNNLDNIEMFIEEIEDAEEIRAELEQEMFEQMVEETNCLFLPKNSSSVKIISDNEETNTSEVTKTLGNVKAGNSFEECFIKETNIDKIRSEGVCVLKEKNLKSRMPMSRKRSNIQDLLRLKRRRKKITTVKVIAVKNRIAELYKRIKNNQQKSQQIFSNEIVNVQQEQETQYAIESLIEEEEERNNKADTTLEVSRKIIGETLITLIPEGTKIPSKMPSPVNTLLHHEFIKNEQLSNTKTNYLHFKKENEKERLAVCPACGKSFRSHFSLTIHKRIHYLESDSSVKLAHKCSDCDQLFNKLSQLKHHVETVHYPEGFICKICNRQLSSISLLERHMVKVHLDRPFNCKQCNKNFSDPMTYEEHLASHNSGQVFKCTTCGRKYSTEYFLMEHMRNHKEQIPQTCVVCGKVTLRITQHMKIHTPRPKRLLSCSECGKVFNFSSGLSHHFKIMHKLPRPPPKLKGENQNNIFKRKRRSRTERNLNKKKQISNSSLTNSTFIKDNAKFSDQIIEEQIEISHEVYDTTTPTTILNLETKENHHIPQAVNHPNYSHTYITNSHDQNVVIVPELQQNNVNHKEEEAKRVIVELIQSSTFTSFFPDNFSSVLEVTPPIAREETISAVNSIVHDC